MVSMATGGGMGGMEGVGVGGETMGGGNQGKVVVAERLNQGLQQQLNLESVKTRALGLFKTISRILEDFDNIARTNSIPKWQDVLGQFSMVNMELYSIVEDIKKVSKAFVVHPKNVNQENATILPVMLSSKLLPEMEAEDNSRREQLLHGLQNLPIPTQIEKLKLRIDMIGAACESAEKVIADARKTYGLGTRQGPAIVPTLDKVQAAKFQEQENLLRAAVNHGEGLRLPGDQRQITSILPMHLVDVLSYGDGAQSIVDASGVFQKNTPTSMPTSSVGSQGSVLQAPGSGAQLIGRSVPSPSGVAGATSFDNTSASPLPYANSPRSGTSMMNTPSPQQHSQQQQQQQRQKLMQLPQHQQQMLAQQQMRQTATAGGLGQSSVQQLQDLQGQTQQKYQSVHGMQYPQSLGHQQYQSRQLQTGHVQHTLGQNQMNQGNQLRGPLGQFAGTANSALFNAAQSSPNSQMIPNMSAGIPSQALLPRMQFGLSAGHPQRNHASQILSDQMFNMGAANPANMVQMQQQQHGTQGGYGSIPTSTQNLQPGMVNLQNTTQNANYPQQRQQNPQ